MVRLTLSACLIYEMLSELIQLIYKVWDSPQIRLEHVTVNNQFSNKIPVEGVDTQA